MRDIGTLFLSVAARAGSRTFLRRIEQGQDVRESYEDAACRVAAITESLNAQGYRAGDKIITYLTDPDASIHLMLACACLGVVIVPLSPVYSTNALTRLYRRVGARGVFTTVAQLASLRAPEMRRLALRPTAASDEPLPAGVDLLDQTCASVDRAGEILTRSISARSGDEAFAILPTSGSTGEPKLIVRSHRSFVDVVSAMAMGFQLDELPPRRWLLTHALTHAAGLTCVLTAVSIAAELAIPHALDLHCSLEEVRALDPTELHLTPRVLRALADQEAAAGDSTGRLFGPSAQTLNIGGASPDPALLKRMANEGIAIVEGYGATEVGPIVLTPRNEWRAGYVGLALPDVTLKLDLDGELLVKSPRRMLGYHDAAELTAQAFTEDGYYRTGDYAAIEAEGWVRILGRKSDIFNTPEGTNISPGPIEALLEALPWARQVVLLGDQRPYLAALIVVDGPAEESGSDDGFLDMTRHAERYRAAVKDLTHLARKLEETERVRRIALFCRPFPSALYGTTSSGKTFRDRKAILERYASHVASLYAPHAVR